MEFFNLRLKYTFCVGAFRKNSSISFLDASLSVGTLYPYCATSSFLDVILSFMTSQTLSSSKTSKKYSYLRATRNILPNTTFLTTFYNTERSFHTKLPALIEPKVYMLT